MITTNDNDRKERLSVAYVTAVAARAGCQVTHYPIDKQSTDLTVRPVSGPKVTIDLQLKATATDCLEEIAVVYDLPIKNYDDLRDLRPTSPHYLVVFVLPGDPSDWLAQTENVMLMKNCAYWLDLRGENAVTNAGVKRVRLPRTQVFDVEALESILAEAWNLLPAQTG